MEFKSVITLLNDRLKKIGYTKKGHIWSKEKEGIYQMLEVDRSNYSKSFTIDIGIYIPNLEIEKGKSPVFPKNIAWCHFSNDLAQLITEQKEKDKFIRNLSTFENIDLGQLESNIDEIFSIIDKYKIFRLLDQLCTYDGIVLFMQNYKNNYKLLHTQNYLPVDIMNFARKQLALFN